MKDLSLHILDIAANSVKAGASLIGIELLEEDPLFTVCVTDDGRGMDAELLSRVTDPYTTTRRTRRVGLGVPLFKMAAEQTGGDFSVTSGTGKGTTVRASFIASHLDKPPLGDMASTLQTLIQGAPDIDVDYKHITPRGKAVLDTRELRGILDGVPLDTPDVLRWIQANIDEQERSITL
jgi:hypothetical protein